MSQASAVGNGMKHTVLSSLIVLAMTLAGCGQADQSDSPTHTERAPQAETTAATQPTDDRATETLAAEVRSEAQQPDEHLNIDLERKPWQGDLDSMVERRVIRVLVPYSKTFYFIDGGAERGISYELMRAFGDSVNKKRKLTRLKVVTFFIPTTRDRLLTDLNAGLGDVVAANLTVTPQRSVQVDFTAPLASGVKEIVVTAADAPPLATLDDLSGREVFVRRASSYYESLMALNAELKKRGKAPIMMRAAPETFEDEDVLEMVNGGLIKFTVVDRYLGRFWSQVYTDIKVREDLVVRDGADIAFAIRKNSPHLKAELDAFMKTAARGTTFGNVVLQKYLENTRWVKNATSEAEMKKFTQLVELFRTYGERYKVDWLLMAAQGYQESGLDQKVRSRVGAVGVMQVMPATGKDMRVGDIHQLEPNIHAGVKYIRFMIDEYYAGETMDELNKTLFAFASYNAGPNRIRSLRQLASKRGLDPNKWFNNVERVVAEKVGSETVQYVSNIYKYYVAYTFAMEHSDKGTRQAPERAAAVR